MGIKLWVDDLRNPASFRPNENWVWAKTVTEAIRILATVEVDEVELDHDVCHAILPGDEPRPGMIYQPVCCPETYEPVARYIALMPKPPKVSFHTANPAGAEKMRLILDEGELRRSQERADAYEHWGEDC